MSHQLNGAIFMWYSLIFSFLGLFIFLRLYVLPENFCELSLVNIGELYGMTMLWYMFPIPNFLAHILFKSWLVIICSNPCGVISYSESSWSLASISCRGLTSSTFFTFNFVFFINIFFLNIFLFIHLVDIVKLSSSRNY